MMKLLFPSHPLKPRLPDPGFQDEFDAAIRAGFTCELYSLEDLRVGDAGLATQRCAPPASDAQTILLRGWMMSDRLYSSLYEALVTKGYQPITNPEQYSQAHYLPNAYPLLKGWTPESLWVDSKDLAGAWDKYKLLGQPAAIVKDFVKSAKHRWNEACFIPAGTGQSRFNQILAAFLEARGKLFEKGIVLRRFYEFVQLEQDMRGQPVIEEYRLFLWDGTLLASTPAIRDEGPCDKLGTWEAIAEKFMSRFISMDIGRLENGDWMIVEVGDGGVSGLPGSIEPETFYNALRERLNRSLLPHRIAELSQSKTDAHSPTT